MTLYAFRIFDWSGRELKNKGKDQLVIPKSGRGRLREFVTIQTGFHNSGRN